VWNCFSSCFFPKSVFNILFLKEGASGRFSLTIPFKKEMKNNYQKKRNFDHKNQNFQRKKNKGNDEEQQQEEQENDSEQRKENRPTWLQLTRTERHTGSYPLEEILQSTDYQTRKITQPNSVKRKYILCVSYIGTNYQGLQINPDANTIEKELEKALLYNGSIIPDNFGFMQKIQWTRAARTDRGVHALTQSIALRLLLPKECDKNVNNARTTFIQQLNSFLPSDIRVQGMIKTNKSFNAYQQCTKRIYHYLLPTYLLEGKETMDSKLQEYFQQQGAIQGAGYEGGYIDPATSRSLNEESLRKFYSHHVKSNTSSNVAPFRLSAEKFHRFQSILKLFEGTKSYHNYTTGKDASEANAKRYILQCQCDSEPFINETTGLEYVRVIIYGQSFLLNQIRKMIGMAIELMRGNVSEELFQLSFRPENRMDFPMIPSLGLYLYDLFFDGYNSKQSKMKVKDEQIKERKVVAAAEENNTVEEEKKEEEQQQQQQEQPEKNKKGAEKEGEDGDDEGVGTFFVFV
jgi:tRNA pseudouridine38-40 synthase